MPNPVLYHNKKMQPKIKRRVKRRKRVKVSMYRPHSKNKYLTTGDLAPQKLHNFGYNTHNYKTGR